MASKIDVYEASDYAGMRAGNATFYYGYERTERGSHYDGDEDNPWLFEAMVGGQTYTLTQEEIGVESRFACAENLMRGIATLIERGLLVAKAEGRTP